MVFVHGAEEIAENNYNIDIMRAVDTTSPQGPVDLVAGVAKLMKLGRTGTRRRQLRVSEIGEINLLTSDAYR